MKSKSTSRMVIQGQAAQYVVRGLQALQQCSHMYPRESVEIARLTKILMTAFAEVVDQKPSKVVPKKAKP